MSKPILRRLEKLEIGNSWWREKLAAGRLTTDDLVFMTDRDLLDYIGLTHPDPEAYVLEQALARGGPEAAEAMRERIERRQPSRRPNGATVTTH